MFPLIAVGALWLAAIYSLVGSGFVILFKTTGVLSLAQGYLLVGGAFVFYGLTRSGGNTAAGIAATLLIMFAVGVTIYQLLFRRLIGVEPFKATIATIALGFLIAALVGLIFGTSAVQQTQLDGARNKIAIGPFGFPALELATIVLALVLIIGFALVLRRTSWGLRMRAVADNPWLAPYTGLRPNRLASVAWGVHSATAALAGICLSMATQLDPQTLPSVGLATFPAILLGGLDSLAGVIAGSIILAATQSVVIVALGGAYSDLAVYSVMLLVLFIRPSGILGGSAAQRL